MVNDNKYGQLLSPEIKLHRQWFREAVKLNGIYILYRYPLPGKHYTRYAEIDANYSKPEKIGCLFHNHPDQKTLKKLNWVSELGTESILIDVDYDLHELQQGCLFIIPSGLDTGKGRLFRLVNMSNSIVYPASITCELVPEYEDDFNPQDYDYSDSDFNLLDVSSEEDPMFAN